MAEPTVSPSAIDVVVGGDPVDVAVDAVILAGRVDLPMGTSTVHVDVQLSETMTAGEAVIPPELPGLVATVVESSPNRAVYRFSA